MPLPHPTKNFTVKEEYDTRRRRNIWYIIQNYKRTQVSARKFSRNMKRRYLDTFDRGLAPLENGSGEISVRLIGDTQRRKYYKWSEKEAIEKIEDPSWRFLDRFSQLILGDLNLGVVPAIFDFFNSEDGVQSNTIGAHSNTLYFIRPIGAEAGQKSGVLKVSEQVDSQHANVIFWMNTQSISDVDLAEQEFREGNRRNYILWKGLMKFLLPLSRKVNDDYLFSNHDVVAILREYGSNQPGSLIIRNLAEIKPTSTQICLFKTPHAELKYKFICSESSG